MFATLQNYKQSYLKDRDLHIRYFEKIKILVPKD